MTTRTILFDSPFLLGFDHTRALIDRAARAAADSYPPYNVEQRGEQAVRITLAVAGFGPDDLTVTLEGRQLTVAGSGRIVAPALAGLHARVSIAGSGSVATERVDTEWLKVDIAGSGSYRADGGEAKALIADGQVKVNGEVELRKRRQMAVGDRVEIEGGPTLVLVATEPEG